VRVYFATICPSALHAAYAARPPAARYACALQQRGEARALRAVAVCHAIRARRLPAVFSFSRHERDNAQLLFACTIFLLTVTPAAVSRSERRVLPPRARRLRSRQMVLPTLRGAPHICRRQADSEGTLRVCRASAQQDATGGMVETAAPARGASARSCVRKPFAEGKEVITPPGFFCRAPSAASKCGVARCSRARRQQTPRRFLHVAVRAVSASSRPARVFSRAQRCYAYDTARLLMSMRR